MVDVLGVVVADLEVGGVLQELCGEGFWVGGAVRFWVRISMTLGWRVGSWRGVGAWGLVLGATGSASSMMMVSAH